MSTRPAPDMHPTLGDVGGRSVVLAYGSVAAEYEALHTRAAVFDRSHRGRLRVKGPRAAEMVTGLVTNDVSALAPGQGCYAAALTAKGKIVADVRVFVEEDGARQLKNIDRPVRVWHDGSGALAASAAPSDRTPRTLPDKPSIAVLPFANMSGDADQEYLADGIVEDIITGLSRFSSLFVIARNSAFTYKGQAVDVKQVGRDLGVRYVL